MRRNSYVPISLTLSIRGPHHPSQASKYPPAQAPIYGGSAQIPGLTHLVKDADELTIGADLRIRCLATPCHTQDSICYYATDAAPARAVFTGDTLFTGGCGRFFEGDGAQMRRALAALAALPAETAVYSGHEYTKGNVSPEPSRG